MPIAKAGAWLDRDTEERKLGEQTGLETRVVLAVNDVRYFFVLPSGGMREEANALNGPPGKYDRKVETQRNWRGGAQPVEHVV